MSKKKTCFLFRMNAEISFLLTKQERIEIVDDITAIEHRLLVKSMHKKVTKGTDSGCLDNQYR